MKRNDFSVNWKEKIKKMCEDKQFKYAIESSLAYIEQYPDDPYIKSLLGHIYICIGEFKQAKYFFTNAIKHKEYEYPVEHLIKIAIEEEDYEEALNLCLEVENKITDSLTRKDVERAKKYIEIKTNKITKDNITTKDRHYYYSIQLLDYSKDRAYNHIQKHTIPQSEIAYFNPNINLEELLNETSERIKIEERKHYPFRMTSDSYYFYYPNVGIYGLNTPVDYFKVITQPKTKNIITMYPVLKEETFEPVPFFNEEKKYEYDETIKAKTGLERFNNKYKVKTKTRS